MLAFACFGCAHQESAPDLEESLRVSLERDRWAQMQHFMYPGLCEATVGLMLLTKLPAVSQNRLLAYRDRLRNLNIGGVVLFKKNISHLNSRQEVAQYIQFLQNGQRRPLFIATDHEGGPVQRLQAKQGFTKIPSFQSLGEAAQRARVAKYGRIMGQELASVGVNINFAPVVDLSVPGNPVIRGSRRAASKDPRVVREMSQLIARGLQNQGVLSVAKHYPGIGSIVQDPHYVDSFLHSNLALLKKRDLLPFYGLIDDGIGGIMSSHVKVPSSRDPNKPVSLSRYWIRELLRDTFNFHGLIVTDDFSMSSIGRHYTLEEAAVEAVYAGNDLLLVRQGKEGAVLRSVCQRARMSDEKASILREEIWNSRERIADAKRFLASTRLLFSSVTDDSDNFSGYGRLLHERDHGRVPRLRPLAPPPL